MSVLLTLLYRPLFTHIDVYKLLSIINIAFVATVPWDSYLIRHKVWTYPPDVIIGPTLFFIPAEECFFFVIQTYNTSLLYFILSKPVFMPALIVGFKDVKNSRSFKLTRAAGFIAILLVIEQGISLLWHGGTGMYLGLILSWVGPFMLLLWTCGHQLLINLPLSSTVLPIAVSTLYLWILDTVQLRKGTWSIESGTKLDIQLWEGLEIEEAVFFLATNVMIVFGLVAFENALTILHTFPKLFPESQEFPSPALLIKALLMSSSNYDTERIDGIREATDRLKKKSRSFFLASSVFPSRLRIDLTLL